MQNKESRISDYRFGFLCTYANNQICIISDYKSARSIETVPLSKLGNPPLEFINIQPPKGCPPLHFINYMGGPPLEFINIQPPNRGPVSRDNFYGSISTKLKKNYFCFGVLDLTDGLSPVL